jgi:hypothetical protein
MNVNKGDTVEVLDTVTRSQSYYEGKMHDPGDRFKVQAVSERHSNVLADDGFRYPFTHIKKVNE